MKFPHALSAIAALMFGAVAVHGQVLLNVDITSPTTLTITATGVGPVTSDSSLSFYDGIDLEGLFAPSGNIVGSITSVTSNLTTGDTSSGPVYNSAFTDSLSELNADLNLYNTDPNDPNGTNSPTQSFTFGLPAFSSGTSMTITFTGLTFSGIDYGVIVAGYSGDTSNAPGGSPVPIGVYHVTGVAPEPSTYAMMLGGLALLGFCVRRRLA